MPPEPQGDHGELTQLSVIGGQELAAAAAETAELPRDSESITAILHGAGAGCMAIAVSPSATFAAVAAGARPLLPVSNTFVNPSGMRVKVNLGQTFRLESIVLEFIVIVPVEALN
jgi:hypothetical protein